MKALLTHFFTGSTRPTTPVIDELRQAFLDITQAKRSITQRQNATPDNTEPDANAKLKSALKSDGWRLTTDAGDDPLLPRAFEILLAECEKPFTFTLCVQDYSAASSEFQPAMALMLKNADYLKGLAQRLEASNHAAQPANAQDAPQENTLTAPER